MSKLKIQQLIKKVPEIEDNIELLIESVLEIQFLFEKRRCAVCGKKLSDNYETKILEATHINRTCDRHKVYRTRFQLPVKMSYPVALKEFASVMSSQNYTEQDVENIYACIPVNI